MIRPYRFYPNPETAQDNAFQQTVEGADVADLSVVAQSEFDSAVQQLRDAGVIVHVVDDTAAPEKPDAVFPNNWLSTHHDGRIALYPMYSELRRPERRDDVIDELRKYYHVSAVVDYSTSESDGHSLEGTGSLVLDHPYQVAYASLSQRTHPEPLRRFCEDFGYEPVTFRSVSETGQPIYHTNVMMCIGSEFALIGLDSIPDAVERQILQERLEENGREIIALTQKQIASFAGNAIELDNGREKLLVMSSRGVASLSKNQLNSTERYARVLPLTLPTIELAGGSARCMLATIHLPLR